MENNNKMEHSLNIRTSTRTTRSVRRVTQALRTGSTNKQKQTWRGNLLADIVRVGVRNGKRVWQCRQCC